MTPPNSGIERALHYAIVNDHSIETSSKLDDDLKKEQYEKLLDQIDSPQKVVELQLRLEEDKPYFQLFDDGAIASYFSRWNVPITTKRDLDLFSDTLAEKVMALAPYNEKVRAQVEQQQYIKQLKGLPAALASLEQAVSEYDTLKPSIRAVVRYVWEAVALNGFKMKEEGSKALQPYQGNLSIQPWYEPWSKKGVEVRITLKKDEDIFRFLINPKYKERILVPAKKRKLWFDRKEKSEKTEELETIGVSHLMIFDCQRYAHNNISPEDIVDQLKKTGMIDLDKYGNSFQTYLEILLSLPKLMNNYTQRTTKSMKGILQRVRAK